MPPIRTPLVLSLVLTGCIFGGGGDGDDVLGGSLKVTGSVVDFNDGTTVTGTASVTTTGLTPSPMISSEGAGFTLDNVPENSTFNVLVSVPPTHHATFSPTIIVTTDDVDGVEVPAVSEAFLASLSTAFGVSPTAARGIMFAQIVDGAGAPRAGIDASTALSLDGGPMVDGPYYLDAAMMPAAAATSTSTSGWAIYFELDAGVAGMAVGPAGNVTVDMPASPINPGAVTLVRVKVTDGATMLPTNVSFAQQIFPIFSRRGCEACHSGSGPGRDLGNLTLDGSTNLVYRELVEEIPGRRINLEVPAMSMVLTMPSLENPPDNHPNVTFTGTSDPDYLLILGWITEGALEN